MPPLQNSEVFMRNFQSLFTCYRAPITFNMLQAYIS